MIIRLVTSGKPARGAGDVSWCQCGCCSTIIRLYSNSICELRCEWYLSQVDTRAFLLCRCVRFWAEVSGFWCNMVYVPSPMSTMLECRAAASWCLYGFSAEALSRADLDYLIEGSLSGDFLDRLREFKSRKRRNFFSGRLLNYIVIGLRADRTMQRWRWESIYQILTYSPQMNVWLHPKSTWLVIQRLAQTSCRVMSIVHHTANLRQL